MVEVKKKTKTEEKMRLKERRGYGGAQHDGRERRNGKKWQKSSGREVEARKGGRQGRKHQSDKKSEG